VERRAGKNEPVFPDYTGEKPSGLVYTAGFAKTPSVDRKPAGEVWDELPKAECTHWLQQKFNHERWRKCGYDGYDHLPVPEEEKQDRRVFWKAGYDREALYVSLLCRAGKNEAGPAGAFREK